MIKLPRNTDGTIRVPDWAMHWREELPPNPLTGEKRKAYNLPLFGIWYTEYTMPWTLEQEKAEYHLFTRRPWRIPLQLFRWHRREVEIWSHGIEALAYWKWLQLHMPEPQVRHDMLTGHIRRDAAMMAGHKAYSLGMTQDEIEAALWVAVTNSIDGD